jgi:2-keto-3-deoxy-galactonokinase
MNESEAIADFKYRTVQLAKSLTVPEARLFLKGVLLCAASDVEDLRAAYTHLCTFDDQLELIASDQLKFLELLRPEKRPR